MNHCQTIAPNCPFPIVSGDEPPHEWLAIFADVTDGLENPSTDDLARAIAAAYFRYGTEPDWNACAKAVPEGMTTLVHEYQRLIREVSPGHADCGVAMA